MQRFLLLAVVCLVLTGVGCKRNLAKNSCNCGSCAACVSCDDGCGHNHGATAGRGTRRVGGDDGYGGGNGGNGAGMMGGGPPVGTYAYPYYTTRAPRDFLMNNPPSIGY